MMNNTIDIAIKELNDAAKRIDELEKMTCDKPLDHPDWGAIHELRWYYDGLKDMIDLVVSYEFGIDYNVIRGNDGNHVVAGHRELDEAVSL